MNSFLIDLLTIQIIYYTDCYHHPLQHQSATRAARIHFSYLSTPPDCQILTFSLECSTETVIRIYYKIVCFIFISHNTFLALLQHVVEWSPLIESWLLSASVWYETFIVVFLVFMRFMLYTVCKMLRLSVFNKERFDWLSEYTLSVMAGRPRLSHDLPYLRDSWHCWLGDRKGIRPVKKSGCWFVGDDDLVRALHVL